MSSDVTPDAANGPVWWRVDEGYFSAYRGDVFLGYVGRQVDGSYGAFDRYLEPLGSYAQRNAALQAVAEQELPSEPVRARDPRHHPAASRAEVKPLSSVTYTSRAVQPFTDAELADLLTRARERNAALEITGMLLYRGGRFMQVLEGPTDAVREVMANISGDPRHEDVRIVLDGPIVDRAFATWTMGFEPLDTPREELPAGYRDTFADLESPLADEVVRAVGELTLWFWHASSLQRLPG